LADHNTANEQALKAQFAVLTSRLFPAAGPLS
jgi:hypothetical protein